VIISDPEVAPTITELFGRFASGRYSLKALVKEANGEGLKLRGRKLYSSVVHQILRKRLYTGDFDWDGTTYTGSHEPLVTRECWQRVQTLLDARAENRTRKVKHDFAYTGLVHCGHCGCLFVGELKKRKYVYYHCTGNRGKCEEPYTRQEILAREFAEVLQELVIPQAILEWLGSDVLTSDQTEQAARAQATKKLQARHEQIQARIETMYLDKLEGRITQEFFDKQSATWRSEQDGLQRKIQETLKATPAPIDQALDMLRLTSRASELFLQQTAAEQRRLLQVVVEKAAWQDGALRTTLFEPFEILRHSNQASYRKGKRRVRTRLGNLAPHKTQYKTTTPWRKLLNLKDEWTATREEELTGTLASKEREQSGLVRTHEEHSVVVHNADAEPVKPTGAAKEVSAECRILGKKDNRRKLNAKRLNLNPAV
jgi:hypothetical protein